MKIAINTLSVRCGGHGEQEVFLGKVLAQLRALDAELEFVLFTDPENDTYFPGFERICMAPGREKYPGRLADTEKFLAGALEEIKPDLLFSSLASAPAKCDVPQILYALSLYGQDEPSSKGGWLRGIRGKALRRKCDEAVAMVAPSEFIRKRLLELFDVPLNKVIVAPLGVEEVFATPQTCIAHEPYLLVVGETEPHKNHVRLREALEQLKEEFPHSLVVVGYPGEAEPENWGGRVVRIDRCPVAHLAGLYQHCALFVCPSLYEGFGLPVLEAMKAGARIAASRAGAIPEIAGDAPTYFEPENVSSIVSAIRRTLGENETATAQRKKFAQQLAAGFTWEKCAWRVLSAFKRAV